MTAITLQRGDIFRAEHDDTFDGWGNNPPRSKFCVVFNAEPVGEDGEVHYFVTTSKVDRYRETPLIMGDMLFIDRGACEVFSLPTLVDCRQLYVIPFEKLRRHRFKFCGELPADLVQQCAVVAGNARILPNRQKKTLRLR